MRKTYLLAATFVLVVGAPGWAATIGPVYPPPGGVVFASGGAANAGLTPGRTWNYTGLDPNAYDELYWGLTSLAGPLVNAPGVNTSQPGTSVVLSGNVATYTFSSPWTLQTAFATYTNPIRYTATASTGTFQLGGMGYLGVWLPVTGTSFSITHLFEVWNGTSWEGVNNFYNSKPGTASGGQVQTSVSAGFWYTEEVAAVPDPASTFVLLGCALFAIALLVATGRVQQLG